MERNEFKNRINLFKLARVLNPLLSYWNWKNNYSKRNISGYANGSDGIDNSFMYVDNPTALRLMQERGITKEYTSDLSKVKDEVQKARDWSSNWINSRKSTGKFDDQLSEDYMQFANNRIQNIPVMVTDRISSLGNASGSFNPNMIKIKNNPNLSGAISYSKNRESNIIHELGHASTIYNTKGSSYDKVYSPQVLKINKLLGTSLDNSTAVDIESINQYESSSPEIYSRLLLMRYDMKANPSKTDYKYEELKPYLNKYRLDFGKDKTELLMNTIALNQKQNNIDYAEDGSKGLGMTPEQQERFIKDRLRYARMSGAITPFLDTRDAIDFTPLGNVTAAKDIYDAVSDKDYLSAGLLSAGLIAPPAVAKPVKRYIPTVTRTVESKINKLLNSKVDLSILRENDWNNIRNRSIERIYDKDVKERAAYIKDKYGVDILKQYDKIHDIYTNNYLNLPDAKITEFADNARAKMQTNKKASEEWDKNKKPATLKDFELQVRKDIDPSREITDHEVNHWWTYDMMQNPDWRKSELRKITKEFEKDLLDKNPLAPTHSDYFRNWMELNAYGINVVNSMKEQGIPFTKENVIKYIDSKSNLNSLKRAAYQFKNMDAYFKWLQAMPLVSVAGAMYILDNEEK